MENLIVNAGELGQHISEFGFMVVCSAAYLLSTGTILFFFIKWFVRIVNNIIDRQQNILDEILRLQREQKGLLERFFVNE